MPELNTQSYAVGSENPLNFYTQIGFAERREEELHLRTFRNHMIGCLHANLEAIGIDPNVNPVVEVEYSNVNFEYVPETQLSERAMVIILDIKGSDRANVIILRDGATKPDFYEIDKGKDWGYLSDEGYKINSKSKVKIRPTTPHYKNRLMCHALRTALVRFLDYDIEEYLASVDKSGAFLAMESHTRAFLNRLQLMEEMGEL